MRRPPSAQDAQNRSKRGVQPQDMQAAVNRFSAQVAPPPVVANVTEEAIDASPFTKLGLARSLVRAALAEGYGDPTPVQAQVIPPALAGRDILALAQTGTGKTAAFVLPILDRLITEPRGAGIRTLILTPTRELAAQIAERIAAYGRYEQIRHVLVYGGVSQRGQEAALRASPDILVATPGRLLDLMGQGFVNLQQVRDFVLDEADRMLDMGFVHDVRRVASALPQKRRTLLFSATMAPAIDKLAQAMLVDPARVSIQPAVRTAVTVEQSVMFLSREQKRVTLETMLLAGDVERAIVFTRTKHGANRLSEQLVKAGISAAAIHGNKSQNARDRALAEFKQGKTPVLVATDVAARGIDVDGISHVINYELPNEPESYVHRIGRTGRAGATGMAISFCDREERPLLAQIERLIQRKLQERTTPVSA
jgi:ATP-dependent RNA helicase RhlE